MVLPIQGDVTISDASKYSLALSDASKYSLSLSDTTNYSVDLYDDSDLEDFYDHLTIVLCEDGAHLIVE